MRHTPLKPSAFSVATLRKQKGMTIVEIMVAMVIMLIVLAAVLLNVSSSTKSGRLQQSLSQMMEDGQIALNTITRGVRNAGYEEFTEVPNPLKDRPRLRSANADSPYLLGCSDGKSVSTTASPNIANWGAECLPAGSTSDSIALRYQGGQLQQIPIGSVSATDLEPQDCSGQPVVAGTANELTRADGSTIMIIDNRFYINNNTLMCWGNGSNAATELVSNIEQMRFWYGVADLVRDSGGFLTTGKVTTGYMTASQVSKIPIPVELEEEYDNWNRVTSVRVCVLVRSREPVSSAPNFAFTDCDGVAQPDPGDGFLRRAMFTTVEIPNVGAGF